MAGNGINVDSLSIRQKTIISAGALDLLNAILAKPNGRELLDQKKRELGLIK